MDSVICLCVEVNDRIEELGHRRVFHEWRLPIHSSKGSLNVVLLHNRDEKLSVSIAGVVRLKGTRVSMEIVTTTLSITSLPVFSLLFLIILFWALPSFASS